MVGQFYIAALCNEFAYYEYHDVCASMQFCECGSCLVAVAIARRM